MSDDLNQQPLFQLNQIAFGYPQRPVFSGVDLELAEGDRLALVGGNGAGKSTLLQLLVGLKQPSAGKLVAYGQPCLQESDFQQVRAKVGLLFQDSDDQLFCPTVIEDVIFGPLNLGKSRDEALAIGQRLLAKLGLSEFADRVTHRLSGGEKRLVALATVLAMEPQVLLLDEPTNGLDEQAEQRLIELLESLDLTMVLVSHDRCLIERLANRAVLMQQGTLVEAVMHSHPHQHSHLHIHPKGSESGDRHSQGAHAAHHLRDGG